MASTWAAIRSIILLNLHFLCLPFYLACSFWNWLFGGWFNSWENKIVMITGAGNGLGREMARQLAKKNTLVLCLDMKKTDLEETIQIIEKETGSKDLARAYVCDITDVKKVNEVRDSVLKEFGKLDVLINNAAFLTISPPMGINEELIRRCIDVNIMGNIWMTRAFLPSMKAINSGQIVFINSFGCLSNEHGFTYYCMTKAAVDALAISVHADVNSRKDWNKIKISTAYPWFMDTHPSFKFAYRSNVPPLPLWYAAKCVLEGARKGVIEYAVPFGELTCKFILFVSRILPRAFVMNSKKILGVEIGQVTDDLLPEYLQMASPDHSHKEISEYLTTQKIKFADARKTPTKHLKSLKFEE